MNFRNKTIGKIITALVLTILSGVVSAFEAPGDPRGTEVGQSQVKWEWNAVPGADKYEVIVDGTHIDVTYDLEYFSFNLWAGEHSLTVRGLKDDGTYSLRTPTIKIIVSDWFTPGVLNTSFEVGPDGLPINPIEAEPVQIVYEVPVPQNPRGTLVGTNDVQWEWDAVSGAESYDVSIDGAFQSSTASTQYLSANLSEGSHSMSVRAVDAQGISSEASSSATVVVVPPPVIVVETAPPPPPPAPVQQAVVEPVVVIEEPEPVVQAPVVEPVDHRQAVDVYLLSGQSNANVETFYYLKHTLNFHYEKTADIFGAAHWNQGGASIQRWIDVNSNKKQFWFNMMEQLDNEVNAQLAANKRIRSINLLWIQGENDALDGISNYESLFTALVNSWNNEIANKYAVPAYVVSGLPWIQSCHNLWNAYFKAGLPPIRQAQMNVANRYDNVATFETSDIYRTDCVHIGDHWLSTQRALETAIELRELNQ